MLTISCVLPFTVGTRVVPQNSTMKVAGTAFRGFGSHCDRYHSPDLTAAAALGTTDADVHAFASRLVMLCGIHW